jgi:hypothetical protein
MSCTPNVIETKTVVVNMGARGPKGDNGISPTPSMANVYISGNETNTAFAEAETYYPIVGTKLEKILSQEWVLEDNKLKYIGMEPITGILLCTLCLSMDVSNIQIRARLAVNGVTQPTTCAQTTIKGTPQSGRRESLAMQTLHTIETGDEIDVHIANWTNNSPIAVRNLQLTFYSLL